MRAASAAPGRFEQYDTCDKCVGAGLGWSKAKSRCSPGFRRTSCASVPRGDAGGQATAEGQPGEEGEREEEEEKEEEVEYEEEDEEEEEEGDDDEAAAGGDSLPAQYKIDQQRQAARDAALRRAERAEAKDLEAQRQRRSRPPFPSGRQRARAGKSAKEEKKAWSIAPSLVLSSIAVLAALAALLVAKNEHVNFTWPAEWPVSCRRLPRSARVLPFCAAALT